MSKNVVCLRALLIISVLPSLYYIVLSSEYQYWGWTFLIEGQVMDLQFGSWKLESVGYNKRRVGTSVVGYWDVMFFASYDIKRALGMVDYVVDYC
jgi:hypothetical protein